MWTHVALMDVTSVNLKVKTKSSHGVIYVSGFRLKSRFVFLYCQDIADKQNASGLMWTAGGSLSTIILFRIVQNCSVYSSVSLTA